MNFTRHLIVVLALIVFFLLIAGILATSFLTSTAQNSASVHAIFGIAKDSYTVIPVPKVTITNERSTFISKIRAALRDVPSRDVVDDVVSDTPKPNIELPSRDVVDDVVDQTSEPSIELPPVIVPQVVPIVEPAPVPVEMLQATTTPVLQEEELLPI